MPGTAYADGVEGWNRHHRQVGRILMLYGLKQKDNDVKPSNGFVVYPIQGMRKGYENHQVIREK